MPNPVIRSPRARDFPAEAGKNDHVRKGILLTFRLFAQSHRTAEGLCSTLHAMATPAEPARAHELRMRLRLVDHPPSPDSRDSPSYHRPSAIASGPAPWEVLPARRAHEKH